MQENNLPFSFSKILIAIMLFLYSIIGMQKQSFANAIADTKHSHSYVKNIHQDKSEKYKQHWQCIRAIRYYEHKHGLPRNLLYAVSTVESGYGSHKKIGTMPWPWTINEAGKSHYFSDQRSALKKLKQLIANGQTNIDVGCAQINWGYHKKYFDNKPENILNPVYNIAYAAHFLKKTYLSHKNWQKAVGYYHSSRPSLANLYINKVYNKVHSLKGGLIVAVEHRESDNNYQYYHSKSSNTSLISSRYRYNNNERYLIRNNYDINKYRNLQYHNPQRNMSIAHINNTSHSSSNTKNAKHFSAMPISSFEDNRKKQYLYNKRQYHTYNKQNIIHQNNKSTTDHAKSYEINKDNKNYPQKNMIVALK